MAGRPLNDIELAAYDLLPRSLAERVRIHRVRALPGGYAGITLGFRILLAQDVDADGTSALLAHELVHVRQWAQQGRIGFSAGYLSSFGRNLGRQRRWHAAYRGIDAEREARIETTDWIRRRARAAAQDARVDDGPNGRVDDGRSDRVDDGRSGSDGEGRDGPGQ